MTLIVYPCYFFQFELVQFSLHLFTLFTYYRTSSESYRAGSLLQFGEEEFFPELLKSPQRWLTPGPLWESGSGDNGFNLFLIITSVLF